MNLLECHRHELLTADVIRGISHTEDTCLRYAFKYDIVDFIFEAQITASQLICNFYITNLYIYMCI